MRAATIGITRRPRGRDSCGAKRILVEQESQWAALRRSGRHPAIEIAPGGRAAWVGQDNGWHEVRLNLLAFQGQNIQFRIRLGTDNSGSSGFIHIDDYSVQYGPQSCGP